MLRLRDQVIVVAFAATGCAASMITRLFPAGFLLVFLEQRNLDSTIGTISSSMTLITMAISPYLFKMLPKSILQISIVKRCLILFVLNAILLALMGIIDILLDEYPDEGGYALALMFILRSLQGFTTGMLYVTMQGDIVDLYLRKNKFCIALISSMQNISTIIASIVAARLWQDGGWMLVGCVLAAINFLPLLFLPAICRILNSSDNANREQENSTSVEKMVLVCQLRGLRKIAFFMPDMAVFLNNLVFNLLIYSLPARMVNFNEYSLDKAVLFLNLLNVFALVGSLTLGYLADGRVNMWTITLAGNFVFMIGCVLAFGSTTSFLQFPSGFEIGSVMAGFGDAAIVNLAIMSKFVLFEQWGLSTQNLGNRSTALYNLVLNFSATIGIVISGQTVTRASEIPALGISGGIFVVVTIGYLTCKLTM